MTEETPEWIDYSKPPPGWSPVVAKGFEDGTFYTIALERGHGLRGETKSEVVGAAWEHYKVHNDPPGRRISTFRTRVFGMPDPKARADGWEDYDRRRAIVVDINDQTGGHLDVVAMLSKLLLWTDDECEEVERYAALPFPRSIDMPQPLQRVLLPETT